MFDFETSTEAWLSKDDKARVWAGCITTIEEDPKVLHIDNSLDDFMSHLIKLGNIEGYFHNLKYDGEYIIAWLFEHGYKLVKNNKRKNKTFEVVISDTNQWYELTIYHKVFNKRYVKTTIFDSLKKIPLSVKDIARAFKLPEQKGEIDYDLYRPVGWLITDEEKDYIKKDCIIVAKALFIQFEKGLTKMTIGSDAMGYFKSDITPKGFKYLFPVLPLEVDNDIRKAYKGGFTYTNPKYIGKEIPSISLDVNSLYPSVMYGNMGMLPYGLPVKFKGKYKYNEKYPLYIQKFSCSFKLKKGYIPTIQIKNNLYFMPTDYLTDSKGIVDLTLTNPDLELFFEHYEASNIEYVSGYMFRGALELFREYIDYWGHIKATSTGGLRQLAKLMLNSLYGKFATNPKKVNKMPYMEDGKVKYKDLPPDYDKPVYTAMGAFITARARAYTISNSQKLIKHWVYSDTDSMYLTDINEEELSKIVEIHPTKLGAWKVEHHITRGKWIKAKTYIIEAEEEVKEDNPTGLKITCAGMPDRIKGKIISTGSQNAFNVFRVGSEFTGNLKTSRVAGGAVLKQTTFKIL